MILHNSDHIFKKEKNTRVFRVICLMGQPNAMNSTMIIMFVFVSPGCPAEFFMTEGSSQCYKLYQDKGAVNWDTANTTCEADGLWMAMPWNDKAAIALRKDLLHAYGMDFVIGSLDNN